MGEKGQITDRYVRYHEEKAKGGCGVVMLTLVGDAYSPRRIHDAILDGTRAARAL